MKIHIGCGTVYLKGWTNVDIKSPKTFLAKDWPSLVEQFITEEHDYYGRHKGNGIDRFRAGPKEQETVCDAYGDFEHIPCPDGFADEILSRQVWEHMDVQRARNALKECYRALNDGGVLRIDVPDVYMTLKLYANKKDNFYLRHFVGPISKGDWGHHCMAYTREELVNLVESSGFLLDGEEPNIHPYPAFCLRFIKCRYLQSRQ